MSVANSDGAGLLDDFLTPIEVAVQLRKDVRTIHRWHRLRTGPPCVYLGRERLYRKQAILDWLLSSESGPPEPARRRRAGRGGER